MSVKPLASFRGPSAALDARVKRRRISLLWRECSRRLERKWLTDPALKWRQPASKLDGWSYIDAANRLVARTGCRYESAERFFHLLEDGLEWVCMAGAEPTLKDRVLGGAGTLRGIVRLPD